MGGICQQHQDLPQEYVALAPFPAHPPEILGLGEKLQSHVIETLLQT
jgi:hypothetical protein